MMLIVLLIFAMKRCGGFPDVFSLEYEYGIMCGFWSLLLLSQFVTALKSHANTILKYRRHSKTTVTINVTNNFNVKI